MIHGCIYASHNLPGICPFVLQPDFKKAQPHLFSYKKSCAGVDGTPKEAEAFHSLDGNTHTHAHTHPHNGMIQCHQCFINTVGSGVFNPGFTTSWPWSYPAT